MTEYRRHFIRGGTCFFTVNLADRSSRLLVEHIAQLRRAFTETRRKHPFEIVAAVILPDHLHTIWKLPSGDANFPLRWRMIKSHFSRSLPGTERRSASRIAKGERGIWQRRFWEHGIRNEEDLRRHIEYIYFNPVRHGHCRTVAEWPYSTFHRYVAAGVYAADWAGSGEAVRGYGE